MPPAEATGRCTPYELIFEGGRLAEREFPAIDEEAERRGVQLDRREVFGMLGRVGVLLQDVMPEDAKGDALDYYLSILFHAYQFWKAGCPVYAVEEAAARSLIEHPPELEGWSREPAHAAFYVELPKNVFWARVSEETPPEPLDGLFARVEAAEPATAIESLVVLGMRRERPGLSVVDLALDPDEARGLPDSEAFRSDLPGADLAGLYSVSTAAEVGNLLLRVLWYVDRYPGAVERVAGVSSEEAAPDPKGPTALDHYRVRRVERSRG